MNSETNAPVAAGPPIEVSKSAPAAAAAAPSIKQGEAIQVRQSEFPTHLKRWVDYWIYAIAVSVSESGVLARVSHPGNRDHNQEMLFGFDDVRTLSDVKALLDKERATGSANEVKALQAQVDRLGLRRSTPGRRTPNS